MRLRCLLLVVIFTLVAFCCSIVDADGVIIVKASAADPTGAFTVNSVNVKHYLKGNKKASTTLADEERGITQKIPFVNKLKAMVKANPAVTKAKVMMDKDIRLKGAYLIVKGQMKPLAIIAAVALAGGFIMYLVKG
ncbi:hypothetical protein F441_21132 [Phytophthora nicotianae CJ01A1]|uniref:RxLR effector protein n=6 Tax=Phytophthora nicotianae TaxID=4792 RepID=W2PII2_PHYN3|nr:hypothetical protein PPTG_18628 [Phytophthora nicotianae INRA-310]ETI31843.1 hypothetical protein F443_21247 [Phytophthora nicotianae P1569]ETK72182.1 hypothetical protein L915_20661 [Phytophthora nicotianae]ETO60559.1 hypothetical protein F444_21263 [Phytophthora nicotianae P1976]ETP01633.1 hypothetical protein F441_21132 [Phytophthora nicotianae CJ01A1]ETP29813.1 hypothetical protein F442_21077 [Phytophthora nicotianae P10297]KUF78635.1 hypothetical protein AM587_10015692 [Phytophthora n